MIYEAVFACCAVMLALETNGGSGVILHLHYYIADIASVAEAFVALTVVCERVALPFRPCVLLGVCLIGCVSYWVDPPCPQATCTRP